NISWHSIRLPLQTLLPSLALVGAVLFWGGSFPAAKAALAVLSPEAVMWSRMALAMIVLIPFLNKLRPRTYRRGDWRPLVAMMVFMPCAYFFLESNALTLTTASQAGVISSSVPLLVALGARMFLSEPLSPRVLAGMALSIGGVAWLTLAGTPQENAPNPLLGNMLEFGAMISAAGYMLIVKRLSDRYGPWTLTMLQTGAGLLFFLPGAPEVVTTAPALPLPIIIALIFLGTCVTLGAFGLYNWALSKLPASAAATSINMVPVAAVFFGWVLLGETLNSEQFLASICVLTGVFITQRRRKNEMRA
ncbi:MAG: DMT family transporter, partial [Desulfovibrionales bacterium]